MKAVVLVVGASRGIGRAIATDLCERGCRVVAWSRSGEAPAGVELSQVVDISNAAQVREAITAMHEVIGSLDGVVINAGITDDGLALRMSDQQWRSVLATNLDGAFFTAQEAVKQMVAQSPQGGSVVFTTSGSAWYGQQRGQHALRANQQKS